MCSQLGFSRALYVNKSSETELDVYPLDRIRCSGNESRLWDCSFSRTDNCVEALAVSVACMKSMPIDGSLSLSPLLSFVCVLQGKVRARQRIVRRYLSASLQLVAVQL